jgi:hypothetical protein
MTISKFRDAPPRAEAMIEALRGLGYSTATAVADIIDNSLSAGAKNVEITFVWENTSSSIAILDDGSGMSDPELEMAMRLGEKNPLAARASGDLGRFGLGLKTASFSQCRQLTVASKKSDTISCLRWDLDQLSDSSGRGWHLLEGPSPNSENLLLQLTQNATGTLVLWQNLDRIVTRGFTDSDFLNIVDTVEAHLAMVFHRFISGPHSRLKLIINGRLVLPWDPFMESNTATWTSPIVNLPGNTGSIELQGYVLPHRDRLTSIDFDVGAGPKGWTAQQGFYVYRNHRLLVAGSWLGLGKRRSWTKDEAHRLARIRLDIANDNDADWKLDIRKSTAIPPLSSRSNIRRLAEDVRERAQRVFAHRGNPVRNLQGQSVLQAWRTEHFKGGMRYRIDEDHPAIRAVLDEAGSLASSIKAMIRILEETIPVQRIWLDTVTSQETPRTGFADEGDDLASVMTVIYKNLILKKGMSPELARDRLLQTEPFNAHPSLVNALPDDPTEI